MWIVTQRFRVLSIEDSVLYTWTLQKKGSASICAVIASQSTKPRGFNNENEIRNQNYLLERTICNICTPKNGQQWRSAGW